MSFLKSFAKPAAAAIADSTIKGDVTIDGDLTVIGEETLKRLIVNGQIRIIDQEPDEETLEKIKKYNKEIIDKRKK